jgi:hypothetical protein
MLADGTITSADMAAGASQAVIGSYLGNPSWNTPSAGAYHETPLQVNCTVTSARTFIKLEASLNVYNDTPGQYAQVLFGANGTARNAMAAVMSPSSNWQVPVSIFIYYADPPGAYRYAVFLYVTSGTASIWNGVQSYLVVTEIRR